MSSAIPYVNDAVRYRDCKYYIFDWDDNILHMPTKIRMEYRADGSDKWEKVELSTATFALVRADTAHYRPPQPGGWADAFRNFADSDAAGEPNCFLEDTLTALSRIALGGSQSPSYNTFRKMLVEGRLFAIVTARGHAPSTIEKAVRIFIEKALTPLEREVMLSNLRGYRRWFDNAETFGSDDEELDFYLSMCRDFTVTSGGFKERMAADPIYGEKLASATQASKPELAKEFAVRDFVEHIFHMLQRTGRLNRPVAIGFSDDDKGNVASVSAFIRSELSKRFDGIKFVVYDTSDRTLAKGRKVCVSGQTNLPGF